MNDCTDGGNPHRYDDIIALPHHVSGIYRPITMQQRAAMFHPFLPLSGYKEKILEAERITEPRRELDEDEKERLNKKLMQIRQRMWEEDCAPLVGVTYFVPDKTKPGGAYVTKPGRLVRIDMVLRTLVLEDDAESDEEKSSVSQPCIEIPIDEIIEIEL